MARIHQIGVQMHGVKLNLRLRFRKQAGVQTFDVVYPYRWSVKRQAKYKDYETKKFISSQF